MTEHADTEREPWPPKFMAHGLIRSLEDWWMVDDVSRVDETTLKVTIDTGQVFWIAVTEPQRRGGPAVSPVHEDLKVCQEDVLEPPGYYYSHQCGRRAKWIVGVPLVGFRGEFSDMPVCGIHVKRYIRNNRPVRPIDNKESNGN